MPSRRVVRRNLPTYKYSVWQIAIIITVENTALKLIHRGGKKLLMTSYCREFHAGADGKLTSGAFS